MKNMYLSVRCQDLVWADEVVLTSSWIADYGAYLNTSFVDGKLPLAGQS